ncbi:MAG TPA: acyl-ACP--UDP-N-acetylglucosamine O-acyltransferase [Porphyromonadaceae bacterium]|jgi:acyl-[acyl-carrier-protein]--UDP-N-acetylglucosamine O-acyltransferase|nr:acyl-ACP--UDP-N-acetylglucosamine O-acyltransferase [Muribaculaceae bacterium Isolate-013 (NCI)]HAP29943.1 acyl-ACP--UDP-N-acetylglucosamine O-acyltransferase [Porphyromonadaceae bacterium]
MISNLAYVDPSAKIADDVKIHPFAFIDKDVEIGSGCEIMPYASVMRGTRMGTGCRMFQGAIVGAEPQDFRWKGGFTYCHIGNNVTIREHVIINRGIRPETEGTVIGDDSFILADSHIGHDTVVKGKGVLGNGVTVAGDCFIDECVILSSNAVVHEKSKIGKWALVKGGCRISGNVPPFVIIAHNPAAYFGVNAVVMSKHGFSSEDIDIIAKAYRNVYQSGISVFNALRRIKADIEPCRMRSEIVDFIENNNRRLVALPIDMLD